MTLLINGVYRDGVFHPDEPVALPDNTHVSMAINAVEPSPDKSTESAEDRERREIHEIFVAAGVVRPGPVPGPRRSTLSPKRRAELARRLAELGPVYDIVREERDSN